MYFCAEEKRDMVERWVKKQKSRDEDDVHDTAEKILHLPPSDFKNLEGYASKVLRNIFLDNRRKEESDNMLVERMGVLQEPYRLPSDDLRLDLEKALRQFRPAEIRVILDFFVNDFSLAMIARKYRRRKKSAWHAWLREARLRLKKFLVDYDRTKEGRNGRDSNIRR